MPLRRHEEWSHAPKGLRGYNPHPVAMWDNEWGTDLATATVDDVPAAFDEAGTGWSFDRSALVWSTCWCEAIVVQVTVDDVLKGRTGWCERVECVELATRALDGDTLPSLHQRQGDRKRGPYRKRGEPGRKRPLKS